MIELRHVDEPKSLIRYRRTHPAHTSWGQDDFVPVRNDIRHSLHDEQQGLCVYCERKVDSDNGHVEHIKPKGTYPSLTYVFTNMAHSCNGRDHCGHYKKNREIPIEPRSGCNSYFQLMSSDGKLMPADDLCEEDGTKAGETISILGLNAPSLARQRQQFASVILLLSHREAEDFLSDSPFRHILQGL